MDEIAIAQSVLESILEEAARVALKPTAAALSYGVMHGIDRDILTEAFESLAEGTPCEGLTLTAMEIPLQIQCDSCGMVDAYELSSPACPHCGSRDFHFLPDAPVLLEDIEFQEPQNR